MALNFDNYNQQVASIQGQLAALQQKQYPQLTTQLPYVPPPQFQSDPVPQQLKYVDGPDGAREFQAKLPYNSSDVVFDKNDDIFYFVYKDANGVSPKRLTIGRFTLEQETESDPMYVTKSDLEQMEARIMAMLSPKQKTAKKTTEVTDE